MNRYILFLLFIILIFLLISYITFNRNIKDNIYFIDIINKNQLHTILKNYLNKVSRYEIVFKTNKQLKKGDLLNFYMRNVLNFTIKEKEILENYVNYINKICKKYSKIKNNWKFVKISSKLEKGMPFTLDKYIFLSDKFLKNMIEADNLNSYFIDTLIHEKIHIIQRFNQKDFNEFYIKHLNIIYSNNLKLSNYWKNKNLKNPDGLDINWIYKYKNNYYLPLLIFNNNVLNQIVIKLNKNFETTKKYKNIRDFELFKDIPENISPYHPNELSAYILPKILLNSKNLPIKLKNKFIKLLNYLK